MNIIIDSFKIMTDLEFWLVMIWFGMIVATFGLFIVVAYLLITGKIKAVFFSIEGNEDRKVMTDDKGGEEE